MSKVRLPVIGSGFDQLGLRSAIAALVAEIQSLYLESSEPWIVGYSGGKDSTACVQLVWAALAGLAPEQRIRTVHVISTDTQVENPIVAAWVSRSLDALRAGAAAQCLPIQAHRLAPALADSFWVCLIGRGYAAPRPKFRWCTERLKIKPSNRFITETIAAQGSTILVLGTRKAESAARARTMEAAEKGRLRERLSPNQALPGSLVYTPIETWTSDDVWMFLMQYPNPWGHSNKSLLTMYQGASADSECPLVVDGSTPSCGDSRFGCWVCTMVEQDKSMAAMISNDEEKFWMQPLLNLRDALDITDDRHLRDFRRMSGKVQLFHGRTIPGPYLQSARADWLRRVLEAQTWVRKNGPEEVRTIELVSLAELREIRRIWVEEKTEIEDLLPAIYEAATGETYPDGPMNPQACTLDLALLRDIAPDQHTYETMRDLLAVEQRARRQLRRAHLFPDLLAVLQRRIYKTEADAVEVLTAQASEQQKRRAEVLGLFGGVDDVDELTGLGMPEPVEEGAA